jgi:phytoene dehydrogenase-like protein
MHMKKLIYLSIVGASLASCSSPKYTAHFRNERSTPEPAVAMIEPAHLSVTDPLLVTASASETPLVMAPAVEVRKTYMQMNRTERKEIRKQIKTQVKDYVKAKKDNIKTAQAAKAIDHDLKLAAIFGAVGLVGLIIGGDVFWIIGGIAMIIGVVFFVKWLIRQ